MPISQRDKEFLLQVQFRSMTETYRRSFPNARYDIIELDRWPIARIVSEVQLDCILWLGESGRCVGRQAYCGWSGYGNGRVNPQL